MTITSNGDNGRNRLLAALPSTELSMLASHLKDIPLTRGLFLHEAGEAIKYLYFPQSGMISLLTVMQNGSAVETATIGREGGAGIMAALGSRTSPHRSVVQLEGRATRIAVAPFEAAVNRSAAVKDIVARYCDVFLMTVQQIAGCNALHWLPSRLCRWLLQASDRTESNHLPLTQEFLSQMLGVRRTTLTLIARELQSAGLIHYRRGQIEIADRNGLETRACECYGVIKRQSEALFSPALA
jgi:CRP-like cAMP-binding protein